MTDKPLLTKKFDQALFRAIDQVKSHQIYHKFQDLISGLPEDQQKLVNLALSYLILSIPVFIFLMIWFMNISLRNEIDLKEQIQTEITRFNQKKSESDISTREFIVPKPIAAQSELQSTLQQMLTRISVPPSNVNVRTFEEATTAGNLKQFKVELTFDKLSTKQFSSFLTQLEQREKMKVNGMVIENRIDQSVLKGRLVISYLTQLSAN